MMIYLAKCERVYERKKILGRKPEIKILKDIFTSSEAEFLAIYGRRRVGKTHLIKEYFSEKGIYMINYCWYLIK